ncbi:PREDICTED: tctex1 domain-containing protein 4 [Ceratotherium simum simum]|uniref:Tctex1 domain-containing protein 4 n=1 Tax=Ceratotherium simum simum TaxID=73337 RepID=A0ABM0I7N6_CERSS|nr:PREDICTED: tctex1 domain-containing protein 4 [Ceratotherium simum simum]
MAGRPVLPRRQEEESAQDPGLKLSPVRPPGRLPSIDEVRRAGPGPASCHGSVLGLVSSFSRRNSLAGPGPGPGARRPSLGPVPPLGSRLSFSGLPLAPARRAAPSYRTEPAPGERWEAARAQRALEAGVRVVSHALWDAARDGLASAAVTNASLFAVAMVHGLYCE